MNVVTRTKREFWKCTKCQKRLVWKNFVNHDKHCAFIMEGDYGHIKRKRAVKECHFCNKALSKNNMSRHLKSCKGPVSVVQLQALKVKRVFERCSVCKTRYLQENLREHSLVCKRDIPKELQVFSSDSEWEIVPNLQGTLIGHFRRKIPNVPPMVMINPNELGDDKSEMHYNAPAVFIPQPKIPETMEEVLLDDSARMVLSLKRCRECQRYFPASLFESHEREIHGDNERDYYWCATCNKLLGQAKVDSHLKSDEHIFNGTHSVVCEACGDLIPGLDFESHDCIEKNVVQAAKVLPVQAQELDSNWEARYEFNALQLCGNNITCSVCKEEYLAFMNHTCGNKI